MAVEQADLADLGSLRAVGDRHEITAIVHLAAVALEEPDPIAFMRRNTAMLLNALEVARTWGVRRFAVASSIGVYIGTPGPRWHEDLALVPATAPNSILAFKKSVEAITPQVLDGTGVEPITLRIGTIWGPLGHPDSPFLPLPRLISATVRGEDPDLRPPRPPGFADDGGDRCYVKDCGRAIALLMRAESLQHDTYNISSGRPVANRRVRRRRQRRGPRRRGVAAPRPQPRRAGGGSVPRHHPPRPRHRLRAGLRRAGRRRGLRRVAPGQSVLTT